MNVIGRILLKRMLLVMVLILSTNIHADTVDEAMAEVLKGNLDKANELYTKAKEQYTRACESGDSVSCYNLGIMYDIGQGVAPNKDKAKKFHEKACTGGFAGGCHNLALMYSTGNGVRPDKVKAFEKKIKKLLGKNIIIIGEKSNSRNINTIYLVFKNIDIESLNIHYQPLQNELAYIFTQIDVNITHTIYATKTFIQIWKYANIIGYILGRM